MSCDLPVFTYQSIKVQLQGTGVSHLNPKYWETYCITENFSFAASIKILPFKIAKFRVHKLLCLLFFLLFLSSTFDGNKKSSRNRTTIPKYVLSARLKSKSLQAAQIQQFSLICAIKRSQNLSFRATGSLFLQMSVYRALMAWFIPPLLFGPGPLPSFKIKKTARVK